MKFLSPLLCFCLVASSGLHSWAQSVDASDYKIYDVKQKRTVKLADVVNAVADTDVLFFGEEHNDAIGHYLQDQLYGLLIKRYGKVHLSLEMFETDCQQVLNEYLAGYITESKMRNDARPWDNYEEAYKPMVEKAKSNNLSVIAANAPRRYVNLVSRKGKDQLKSLPKSARRYLAPLPIRTDDAAYLGRFNAIMGDASHSADNNFFEAQCTWDATMAHRIYRHWKKNKKELIFQLNGRFHSDYQQGTVGQLKRLRKKIKVKNISCFSAEDFDAPNWSQYTDMGDFIILSRPSDS